MEVFEKNKILVLIVSGMIIGSIILYRFIGFPANEQPGSAGEISLESIIREGNDELEHEDETENPGSHSQFLHVDIKGAVETPGVYEMKTNQRVIDVIQAAGGLKDDSDPRTINFARQLEDEMMIYIPYTGEEIIAAMPESLDPSAETSVNINQADLNGLLSLNGIGPQKAQEIMTYREKNGPFSTIQDITNVSGIGEKTFEKIQDQITVK